MLIIVRAVLLCFLGTVYANVLLAGEEIVLVSRSDMKITESDYRAAVAAVVPPEKRALMEPTVKQAMLFMENVMINRKLAQEARELGLDQEPLHAVELQQVVERTLGKWRKDYFLKNLKRPDFSAAAREKYIVRSSDYIVPEAVKVSHILVGSIGRDDATARSLAEKIRQSALKGDDFVGLIKLYSDDPSKDSNQGDLGWFERGTKEKPGMVKPFEDAAFALRASGDISSVTKTQFGYHIIRLAEKRPVVQKKFDEVKENIIEEIERKFVSDAWAIYVSEIKNDKSIVIDEKAIEALRP